VRRHRAEREEQLMRRLALLACVALTAVACGGDDDDASVTLRSPEDGARIAGAVSLEMAADGITIEEAGEARDGAGHFHVIVDDGCVATGESVPKDADHVHFGKGQKTGTVYLTPGEHELCLQAADGTHVALPATDTISVTAGIESREEWCEVVEQVDVLFEETDTQGDAFEVRQVGYTNIRRLADQLLDAVDVVDASVRDAVSEAMKVAQRVTTMFIDATDERAATDEVGEFMATQGVPTIEAATEWISDTCGVDING
jgi:hypothetical protein